MTFALSSPFAGYVYAYPHKTAYRPLVPAVPLADVWQEERKDRLFLYIHVPFCEMRCGFCNLFTTVNPAGGLVERYLETLRLQAEETLAAIRPEGFARFAIGGGTPTFVAPAELDALFGLAGRLGADTRAIPTSVEASPATLDAEKLAVLKTHGTDRVSLGVQTVFAAEARALGRPQHIDEVERAVALVRAAGIPILNIDLIYGGAGQTAGSWQASLDRTLSWQPEEIYLYPLYVRPFTGLGKRAGEWDDLRLDRYRAGRDRLLSEGYEQVSMRMFRRPQAVPAGPVYCCQDDGMVGLGCGARSYTRGLHYGNDYAVGRSGVLDILKDWISRDRTRFRVADHGFALDADEQRRRFLILSLLQVEGLSRTQYRARFATDVLDDFPELEQVADDGLGRIDENAIRLGARGLELSDAIGPWLFSRPVRTLMQTCPMR